MIETGARLLLATFVAGVILGDLFTFIVAFARRPPRHVLGAFLREVATTLILLATFPLFALLGARFAARHDGDSDEHSDDTDRDPTRPKRRPVILLHGYAMNRTNWLWLGPALTRRGVGPLYGLSYFSLTSIENSARRLGRFVAEVARREGVDQVDIVAHSMGGIVARCFIEHQGGGAHVARLVTIGTPHHGTRMAGLVFDGGARDLKTGSAFLSKLGEVPPHSDYTSIWSRCDNLVVPPESAQLTPLAPEEGESRFEDFEETSYEDIVFDDLGHLSLLVSPRVADAIARRLAA